MRKEVQHWPGASSEGRVARAQKNNKFARFGISYSPWTLPVQFTAKPSFGQQFVAHAVKNWKGNGFTVFGTMGIQKEIMDIKHDPQLIKWYQTLAGIDTTVPNATLFIGLRLLDDGNQLATKKQLATDLFEALRDMKAWHLLRQLLEQSHTKTTTQHHVTRLIHAPIDKSNDLFRDTYTSPGIQLLFTHTQEPNPQLDTNITEAEV
ncbi:hypothetical protein HPB52_006914 [Rhipicephalus sanguineus]|uniref:Uncharacterized protein n=1 Tax=Rhipicephalus sanguineus TaxID=34632 RepID=A0A9D4T5S9_RHISA|nr:hypothetical protein HPB52_006914 [Rhipicephalus sanguineus]